jgi:8-oxo-dGTP diphosphatase
MSQPRVPRLGSAVVVISQDRVLLGRRAKDPNRGKWVLPGGGVRPFESIADAGRREILEETGLEIEVDDIIAVREIINAPDEHRLIVFSAGRPIAGRIRAASDLEDVRFCSQDELPELDLSDVVLSVLDQQGWIRPIAA